MVATGAQPGASATKSTEVVHSCSGGQWRNDLAMGMLSRRASSSGLGRCMLSSDAQPGSFGDLDEFVGAHPVLILQRVVPQP